MRRTSSGAVVAAIAVATALSQSASGFAPPPCEPATLSLCRSPGYYDTSCGLDHRDECFQLEYFASSAPVEPISTPDQVLTDAGWVARGDAELGKHEAFDKGAISLVSTLGTTLDDVSMAPSPFPLLFPPGYVRYPAYETDGNDLATCKEYVHKKYYDYNRFSDSASLCRDADCVYDVAYYTPPSPDPYGPPAIANRTLLRKDGVPMPKQIALAEGVRPKNPFFSVPYSILTKAPKYKASAPGSAQRIKYDAIIARLASTPSYAIGTPGAPGWTYPSPWDWHAAMHAGSAGISSGERQAIAKRLARLQPLLDEATAYIIAEAVGPESVPIVDDLRDIVPSFVSDPGWGDPSRGDPFAHSRATSAIFTGSMQGAISVRGDWFARVALHPTGQMPFPEPSPQGQNNGPMLMSISTGPVPTGTGGDPPKPDVWLPSSGLSVIAETWSGWQNELLTLLEKEWDRGATGCLDTGYLGCDWSPEEFTASVQNLFQTEREHDYQLCRRATGDTFSGTPFSSIEALETHIKTELAKLGESLKGLPKRAPDGETEWAALGEQKKGGKELGVPGLFGAKYDYDFGWKVEVTEKTPAGHPKGAGLICRIGAGAWGDLHAEVWYPSNNALDTWPFVHREELVDAHNRASLGKTEAKFHSDLRILGADVYSPFDESIAAGYSKSDTKKGNFVLLDVSKTIVVMGIPVTLKLWSDLDYGYDYAVSVTSAGACDPDNVSLGVHAEVTPFAKSNAHGSVAIGIPGLGVGVDGHLNLVTAHLPAHARVTTKADPSGQIYVVLDHDGHLELDELAGRMTVFAEALFWRTDKEIFSWDGLHQDIPLWHYTHTFPVFAFDTL